MINPDVVSSRRHLPGLRTRTRPRPQPYRRLETRTAGVMSDDDIIEWATSAPRERLTSVQRRLLDDTVRLYHERDEMRTAILDAATNCQGYARLQEMIGADHFPEFHACIVGICWRITDLMADRYGVAPSPGGES